MEDLKLDGIDNKELTQESLKELLHYNPMTGIFTWIKPRQGVSVGSYAGKEIYNRSKNRYVRIRLLGKQYMAHRLAFLYITGEWPRKVVDHINGVGRDNRWGNLRDVTQQENCRNSRVSKQAPGKVSGVHWNKDYEWWEARIGVGGKQVFLENTYSKEEAIKARKAAEIKYGYSSTHGQERSWIEDKTLPQIYELNLLRDRLGLHPELHGLQYG